MTVFQYACCKLNKTWAVSVAVYRVKESEPFFSFFLKRDKFICYVERATRRRLNTKNFLFTKHYFRGTKQKMDMVLKFIVMVMKFIVLPAQRDIQKQ